MSLSVISLKTGLLNTNDIKDLSNNLLIPINFENNDSSTVRQVVLELKVMYSSRESIS